MRIALIFSKPISEKTAKMFCKTFIHSYDNVKALYLNNGEFSCWSPSECDDAHCFNFAKDENYIPIYITIL